jgi:pentatricopeptide repeat domain-containing protein 1
MRCVFRILRAPPATRQFHALQSRNLHESSCSVVEPKQAGNRNPLEAVSRSALKRNTSRAFVQAIKDCRQNWRNAISLLNQMQRENGCDVFAFSAAISVCGNAGQWGEALELLSKMDRLGIKPNAVCFNAVITACGRGGQWEESVKLFWRMGEQGIEVSVVSFNAAITACARAGKWKESLELLEAMNGFRGVEPDVKTFSACISACEKGLQWARALKLLEMMRGCGVEPNIVSVNAAIRLIFLNTRL